MTNIVFRASVFSAGIYCVHPHKRRALHSILHLQPIRALLQKIRSRSRYAKNKMASLEEAFDCVTQNFGFQALNSHQKDAIQKIVIEKKEVFINLPTGYRKSLIFQALLCVFEHNGLPGQIVVVESPLINLIKDQDQYLNSIGVPLV